MMKMRFVLPIALLVIVLAGCKAGGGEAAVIGKWKSDIKTSASTSNDPQAKMMQSLMSIMSMDVEIKADHKYKMTVMGMVPIEGDWSMSGSTVTLDPKTVMGVSTEEFLKEQKAKNPGTMAATNANQGTQQMILELQSDGKTLKAVPPKGTPDTSGMELTFSKQQ